MKVWRKDKNGNWGLEEKDSSFDPVKLERELSGLSNKYNLSIDKKGYNLNINRRCL